MCEQSSSACDNAGAFIDNTEKKSQKTSREKPNISVVEGSFRRIAGICEVADVTGTFLWRKVEILREPGKSVGFYIRQGDGWERKDGVFISRFNLGSIVETHGLLRIGDEITKVNDINVTEMSLENVAVIMRYVKRLFLTVKVLTSPTLVHTYSQRHTAESIDAHKDPLTQAQPNTSTPKSKLKTRYLQGVKKGSPLGMSRGRVIVSSNEEVVPYAYTRIGGMQSDTSTESSAYETIRHAPLDVKEGVLQQQEWISTESLQTLGSTQGEELNVIDYKHINQLLDTQQYCGQLTLVLDVIDNLISPSNGAPLSCSIACDSEVTIEVIIPTHQQEWEMKLKHEYNIQLNQNRRIVFTAFNGLLSSTKTIPLSYFIPVTHEMKHAQEFALNLDAIGRLKFSLGFCPFPAAVLRWTNTTTNTSGTSLKELVASNMTGSGLPLILERAIQVIEEYGIETVGLYQRTASQEAKRQAFDACLTQRLHLSQFRSVVSLVAVHAFSGVLKDFFLDLPEPIFNSDFTASLHDAMHTIKLSEEMDKRADRITSAMEHLPSEVYVTTCALLTHLRNICQHGPMNKLTVEKISQLFAPLLFTSAHSHQESAGQIRIGNYSTHAFILKTLILQLNAP